MSPRSSLRRPSPAGATAPPAETPSPLSEYLVAKKPGRRERAENWRVAIGLQKVDGLRRIGSRKTGRWEFPPHPNARTSRARRSRRPQQSTDRLFK